ncbi:hypothetical protein [Azohydromonas sp.]|uniref:hypothetical protein n=1 Tax=Azohydromonas sp. TaxID=1872666 RepID=UPI002CB5A330|nr:hypothetical protein [Azohydromonas sp.]HMM83969.1 hypothetical protein [Azohydromonas sp.]
MTSPRRKQAPTPAADETPLADDLSLPGRDALVQHPDGWYWLAPDGKQQFGPFDTAEEALADMGSAADDEVIEPGETLQEVEDELGLADWVDPDTGTLAEGTHTRIEDH